MIDVMTFVAGFIYIYTHLAQRVISGPKKLISPSLSLNVQDSSAMRHLHNGLVLFEKIEFHFIQYFSYGELIDFSSSRY